MSVRAPVTSQSDEWETPQWLFDALNAEFGFTLDPCTNGENHKCEKHYTRIENGVLRDWKTETVFMNPPFSLACEFVDHARMMGARKIICFQRYAWREGALDGQSKRGTWWEKNPPARIWLCGDRAQCLRFDLRGQNIPKPPTAHAWFVWERGHRGAEITRGLYKK